MKAGKADWCVLDTCPFHSLPLMARLVEQHASHVDGHHVAHMGLVPLSYLSPVPPPSTPASLGGTSLYPMHPALL